MRRAVAQMRVRWGAATATVRDASSLGRAQATAGTVLVVVVLAAFAYGAVTQGGAPRTHARALTGAIASGAAAADGRSTATARGASTRRRPLALVAAHALAHQGRRLAIVPNGAAPARRAPRGSRRHRNRSADKPAVRRPDRPSQAPAPATPVAVGVIYQPASATARVLAALGLNDIPGDTITQARAVATWITAHGGITGRPLVVLDAPLDRTAGAAFSQACASLVAGTLQPVAVIARADDAAEQTGCLAAHRLTLVGDAPAVGDSQVFAQAGDHLFAPGSMALDRLARAYVRVLRRERFLEPGTRVGVLRLDEPMFERADRSALRPALADAGAAVVADAAVPRPRAVGDAPGVVAGVAAAAVRFRLARVNRVVGLDDGVAVTLFMRAAEALGFRPRYGVNSTMAPAALPGRVARGQLRGAVGVGFAPLLDVAGEREPAPPASRRRCEDIYRAAGVALGARTMAGAYGGIATCDALLAVRAGLERADEATAGALPRALATLGGEQSSALALTSRLDRGRHDGALTVRALRFDDTCGCFEYSGAEEVVP